MNFGLWHCKSMKISVNRAELCTKAIQKAVLTTFATCSTFVLVKLSIFAGKLSPSNFLSEAVAVVSPSTQVIVYLINVP